MKYHVFVRQELVCNKHDDEHNLELCAKSLAFSDASAYSVNVAEQCALGNHENCDVLNNGTHQACAYADHSGTNHSERFITEVATECIGADHSHGKLMEETIMADIISID